MDLLVETAAVEPRIIDLVSLGVHDDQENDCRERKREQGAEEPEDPVERGVHGGVGLVNGDVGKIGKHDE